MGSASASHSDHNGDHGRRAVRDRARGHAERGAAVSDGRRAHAGVAWTDDAPARPAAANTFHRGEHVGRIAAPPAKHRASMAHSVLQRHVGRIAAAARRRTFVPDADVVPHVHGTQRTHDARQTWTGIGIADRAVAHNSRRQSRPDVDGPDRRHACLSRASHTRGHDMNPLLMELWPYFLMVLVGYLPNEVWRVFGLVLARGLNEDSQVVVWSRAVATAILAGVIAKLILFSTGALAAIPLSVRVIAAVLGFLVFLGARRSVFAGVLAGEIALLAAVSFFRTSSAGGDGGGECF